MNQLTHFLEQLRQLFRTSSRTHLGQFVPARYLQGVLPKKVMHGVATAGLLTSLVLSGCSARKFGPSELKWLDGEKPVSWYKGHNTAIEHPAIDNETEMSVQMTEEPRSLQRSADEDVREISLDEVILLGLQNNKIIEQNTLGGTSATRVLTAPDAVDSVYDSAIQETGVLFGRRGLEAALSDFDTRLSTSMTWGRNTQGVHALPAPGILSQETGLFRTSLDKSLASGGAVSVYHDWNYTGNAAGAPTYPSSYAGTLGAQVRQPLLAGAGTEFTRVAGPVRPGFGAIAGVSQGVVIARINQDITLADFELAVRNGLRTIEDSYWDLYLAYRNYDNAVETHNSAFETWRVARVKLDVGNGAPDDELQARDEFYRTRSVVELSLNRLYQTESFLRRVLGLPMNDGTVLRPSMEPMKAEFQPDWHSCLVSGLTNRAELRRQKWQIKSLQLQLDAARSLVRPQLDVVGNYGVNGFGDKLLSQNGSSGYGSMTGDNLETWAMGVEMSMPIGFRLARSQVKNYELQLAKASAVLATQERSVAHDITISIQDVAAAWAAAQSNLNRLRAAERRVEILKVKLEIGTEIVDLVLRAQSSLSDAEQAYYEQIVAYNKAITFLHLSTGTLLDVNNVQLAEGRWDAAAYGDATMRAVQRTHATENPHLDTEPREFVSPGPAGTVETRGRGPLRPMTQPYDEDEVTQPVPDTPSL